MKILFEEYPYKTESVQDILSDFILPEIERMKDKQQLKYVGYFFNKNIINNDGTRGDLVFILPKVLMDAEGKAFGISPEQVLHFSYKDWKSDDLVISEGKLSKRQVYDFIYGFTTWIYRAVNIYRINLQRRPREERDDIKAEVMTSLQVGQSNQKSDATFMDILLSLIDFEKTHKGFISYTIKMTHSGFNKLHWSRTIARTQAVLQDESPLYLNPINKKKIVDFDEELLIIYYSILDYIHEEYGFPIPNQPGYKLIKGAMFRSYLKSQGKIRLHKIRYKYYSDDAILLWNLCYQFFEKADSLKAQLSRKDYLLVNKFEIVFEAMIDELVGDKNLPDGLKVSADDKRIDHLYTYKYLLENIDDKHDQIIANEIYNIADSKYYKRDKGLRGHDVPKQFTYARNVIQWHMDLLHGLLGEDLDKAEKFKAIKLFDPLTEGYNIIPNFFISAQVDDELNYNRANFQQSTLQDDNFVHESYIFWERLFDRNTYFTLHYDVNFLFILKMYSQNKSYNKELWKEEIRSKFRQHILQYLNEEFLFWQIMVPESDREDFVERHYRKLIGKIFGFEDIQGNQVLLYAERKRQAEGKGNSYKFDATTESYIKDDNLFIPYKGTKKLYGVVPIALGKDNFINTNEHQFERDTDSESNIIKPKLRYQVYKEEIDSAMVAEDTTSYGKK